jgi:hypothetical protein
MAMLPHERSLVKRLEGKPFALLGINTDTTREELKQVEKKHQITWRSWFDGQGGPICRQYAVRGFPTIYVLDHKGVIRFEGTRGKAMDEAVDQLLKEMESEKQ